MGKLMNYFLFAGTVCSIGLAILQFQVVEMDAARQRKLMYLDPDHPTFGMPVKSRVAVNRENIRQHQYNKKREVEEEKKVKKEEWKKKKKWGGNGNGNKKQFWKNKNKNGNDDKDNSENGNEKKKEENKNDHGKEKSDNKNDNDGKEKKWRKKGWFRGNKNKKDAGKEEEEAEADKHKKDLDNKDNKLLKIEQVKESVQRDAASDAKKMMLAKKENELVVDDKMKKDARDVKDVKEVKEVKDVKDIKVVKEVKMAKQLDKETKEMGKSSEVKDAKDVNDVKNKVKEMIEVKNEVKDAKKEIGKIGSVVGHDDTKKLNSPTKEEAADTVKSDTKKEMGKSSSNVVAGNLRKSIVDASEKRQGDGQKMMMTMKDDGGKKEAPVVVENKAEEMSKSNVADNLHKSVADASEKKQQDSKPIMKTNSEKKDDISVVSKKTTSDAGVLRKSGAADVRNKMDGKPPVMKTETERRLVKSNSDMKAPPVISVAKKTTSDAKYVRKAVADSSSHKHDSSSMKKEADNNDTKAAAPVINVAKKTMIDQNNYRVISKQIRDLLRQRKILVTKGSSTQTVDGQLSTLEQMRKAHGFNSKGDKTSEQLLEVANELRKERTYRYDAKLDTKGVIEELDKVKTMMRAEQLEK
eukprot:CAMPEP_0183722002 /NCGR_PEP_ID=MMETSP0737-20130205/14084_1 /TAXON_ID=385413 /ORGANISM="Thalassiosira miniscula, Strain CCMP1093" /LENGTH=636 /DNA_ID=CAMNT_0025952083 /DNA_START=346 /DNA_END=2256 /DNA_ORIENTATION=-